MKSSTTGIAGFDALLGGGLPESSIIGLSGPPGTGKQSIAAAFALSRTGCCWVSLLEGPPYLPPAQGDQWTESVEAGILKVATIDLLDKNSTGLEAPFKRLLEEGAKSFVILHAEILGLLTSPAECVRLVYTLRKAGCEALFVADESVPPAPGRGRLEPQPWEALATILLRTEAIPDETNRRFRLSVPKPPTPEMIAIPAEYVIEKEGVRFVTRKGALEEVSESPLRQPRGRPARKRRVCRVLPEMFYLDAAQHQYAQTRNEEINAGQGLVHYQMPQMTFADSIEYNKSFERFRRGEPIEELFIIDIYRLRECIEKGLIQPLDSWVDDKWRSRFLPQALEACTTNGQLWAIPHWMNAGVMIYRRDLLEKHGQQPPRTFNQLVETSNTILSREGRDRREGFGFQGAVAEALSCTFLEFLWNHGGDFQGEDLKPRIHEKAGIAALEFMRDLIHDLKISPADSASLTEPDTARLFWQDKLLFMRSWPNFLCRQSPHNMLPGRDCIGMAPLPTLREGQTPQSVLGGFAYVLPSHVIDPEPALTYHSRFHDEQGIRQMALTGWCSSPYKDVYEDKSLLKERPWYAELPSILAMSRSRQDVPSYHRVTLLVREEVNLVLRNLRSPKEALEQMTERLESQVLRQAEANRLHETIEYLRENLDKELSREEIAARCHLNPSYFSSLFKEVTGETFRRFVNRERIRKAQRLLVTSEQSASEIAKAVGFTDPSYFSQVFREYIGMTPIQHRSQARDRIGHN